MVVPTSVQVSEVAFGHDDRHLLFERVSFQISRGWTAVVGPNGIGKTTLLRIIAGELVPSRGHVRIAPADALVTFTEQEVTALEGELEPFAYDFSKAAMRARAELGLDEDSAGRFASLSAGERKRFQLAAALSRAPDVWILDEPTNHLDREARRRLEQALRHYAGTGIIVSHDRSLLDSLVTRTLVMAKSGLRMFDGNYTFATAELKARRDHEIHERRERARESARLTAELRRREERRAAADRSISARSRMKGVRDHDARSALAKGRSENAARSLSRRVTAHEKRVTRSADRVEEVRFDKVLERDLFVRFEPAAGRFVVRVELPALMAGRRVLRHPGLFALERDQRIRLVGPNGAGKSTFFRSVVGACSIPRERFIYLPQELSALEQNRLVDELIARSPGERGAILSIVAALGVEPSRLLDSRQPSPGEIRKLALALGLARNVHCLFLDEPENHLDAPSIERLESMLDAYPGAIMMATHDDRLAETLRLERFALLAAPEEA